MAHHKTVLGPYIKKQYVVVDIRSTVGQAIEHLRQSQKDFKSKYSYIYVSDENGGLKGVLQTRDLLLSEPSLEIAAVTKSLLATLSEDAGVEEAASLFVKNNYY